VSYYIDYYIWLLSWTTSTRFSTFFDLYKGYSAPFIIYGGSQSSVTCLYYTIICLGTIELLYQSWGIASSIELLVVNRDGGTALERL